jgi:hypothetical protein
MPLNDPNMISPFSLLMGILKLNISDISFFLLQFIFLHLASTIFFFTYWWQGESELFHILTSHHFFFFFCSKLAFFSSLFLALHTIFVIFLLFLAQTGEQERFVLFLHCSSFSPQIIHVVLGEVLIGT